jgi:hypothetical protein
LSVDPVSVLARVYDYLELPPHRADDKATRLHTAEYVHMDADVRTRLTRYFRPHNERLYELLGIDFGWERESTVVSV